MNQPPATPSPHRRLHKASRRVFTPDSVKRSRLDIQRDLQRVRLQEAALNARTGSETEAQHLYRLRQEHEQALRAIESEVDENALLAEAEQFYAEQDYEQYMDPPDFDDINFDYIDELDYMQDVAQDPQASRQTSPPQMQDQR